MPRENSLQIGDVFALFLGTEEERLKRAKPFRGAAGEGMHVLRPDDEVALAQILDRVGQMSLIAVYGGTHRFGDLDLSVWNPIPNGENVWSIYATDPKGFVRGWYPRVGNIPVPPNVPFFATYWRTGMYDRSILKYSPGDVPPVESHALGTPRLRIGRSAGVSSTSNGLASTYGLLSGKEKPVGSELFYEKKKVPLPHQAVWNVFPDRFFPGTWYLRPEIPEYEERKALYPKDVVEAIENGTYTGIEWHNLAPLTQAQRDALPEPYDFSS